MPCVKIISLKGLGHEIDFKEFDENGQIYMPNEGARQVFIFFRGSCDLI